MLTAWRMRLLGLVLLLFCGATLGCTAQPTPAPATPPRPAPPQDKMGGPMDRTQNYFKMEQAEKEKARKEKQEKEKTEQDKPKKDTK